MPLTADPVERTRLHLAAVGAADQLPLDGEPGIALDLDWSDVVNGRGQQLRTRCAPDCGSVHDWQHDLWWPGDSPAALLRALHVVDQRALTSL